MKKVLIVEDEPDVSKVLKYRVENHGHHVLTAGNGKEALEILKSQAPDLIISDIVMPEMDGFQLYKELKAKPATKNIPVLILTARGKMEDTFRVMGVDDFISKPYDEKEFSSKVSQLLNLKPAPEPVITANGPKILLASSDPGVFESMVPLLGEFGVVSAVRSGREIIAQCPVFKPKILLINLLMDDVPSPVILAEVRKMEKSENIVILLFSYYQADGLSGEDVQEKIITIENAREQCLEIGNFFDLGPYNPNTFLKSIATYI